MWYLNIGDKAISVQTGNGEVVSVAPHTKVEIGEVGLTTRRQIGIGLLRVTNAPKGVVKEVERKVVEVVAVEPTRFAAAIIEKKEAPEVPSEEGTEEVKKKNRGKKNPVVTTEE